MNPATLSDSTLDASYAAAYDAGDMTLASAYASEILTRLQSVGSFLEGLLGFTRFPMYEARGGFAQVSAARGSTADAAANVPQTIGTAAGNVLSTAGQAIGKGVAGVASGLGVTNIVIIAGAGALLFYFAFKK